MIPLAIVLGLCAAGLAGVPASEEETVELLTRMKHELGEAYVQGDVAALDRIYAEDYTVIDAEGRTRTKDDDVRALLSKDTAYEFSRYEVTSVKMLGDAAVLVGRGEVKGTRAGNPFHTTYVSTNVYVRRDGEWKIVTAHISGSRPVP